MHIMGLVSLRVFFLLLLQLYSAMKDLRLEVVAMFYVDFVSHIHYLVH
jgi:hypothetical protein